MGAAFIAARYKSRFAIGDFLKRCLNVFSACDFGRIRFGSEQHKVIKHHFLPFIGKPLRYKKLFRRFVMHKHHIGIATATNIECLASSYGNHFDGNTGFIGEYRQNMAE